jgi:hypothetical protein
VDHAIADDSSTRFAFGEGESVVLGFAWSEFFDIRYFSGSLRGDIDVEGRIGKRFCV